MGQPQASRQQEREAVCIRRQDDCIGPPVTVPVCVGARLLVHASTSGELSADIYMYSSEQGA